MLNECHDDVRIEQVSKWICPCHDQFPPPVGATPRKGTGDFLVGDFIPALNLLCINSYANLSANSCTGSSLSFLLWQKEAYQYPFHASVTQNSMMVVTNLNQAFWALQYFSSLNSN
jgi:hypothetical protein